MNILYAVTMMTRPNGGVCTHILDLCKGFSDANVVLVADGNDFKDKTDALKNVTYIDMPFISATDSVGAFIRCYRELKEICKQYKIDVIHLHGQRLIPLAWMIKNTMKIPYLWTNHIDAIPQPKVLSAMARLLRFPIISVSSDCRNQLVQELHISPAQITVICNGVDLDRFQILTETERYALRESFGIQEGEYVVAELARLQYVKGQDLLVRAIHKIITKYPDLNIKLLFAGSGDMEWFQHSVLDYCDKNGIPYNFLGFQSPRDVFGVADLAALPSLYEGFALVCTEALAMECPVVRSDAPGSSDMSDITLVHRKRDLNDLIEKLEYAITHPEDMKTMAAVGRKKCESVFNVDEMCRQTMCVYRRVIEGTF